jgi:hypothetical protein
LTLLGGAIKWFLSPTADEVPNMLPENCTAAISGCVGAEDQDEAAMNLGLVLETLRIDWYVGPTAFLEEIDNWLRYVVKSRQQKMENVGES